MFVLLLSLLPVVDAMGISPPRAQLTFTPSTRYDFSVTLINNQPFPIEVETRVTGIIEPTTAIRKPIKIAARSNTVVPIAIVTPASLPRPGYITSYIFFAEKYLDEEAGTISTRTEVGLTLVLWQPYPGQYAEIVASAPSVPEGKDTALKLLVSNLGVEPIVEGKGTVRVLAADGALQDVFTFPNINVGGDSNEDYFATIVSSGYNPGKYSLQAKLEYGENTSYFNGSFAVGTRDIDLIAIEGPFYLDKPVNRYTVHVESLWNEQMDTVFATVQIGSSKSTTPSIQVPGFSRATLTNFWETDGSVVPGTTVANVNITFPDGAGGFLSVQELLPITIEAKAPVAPVYEEPTPTVISLSGPDVAMLLLAIILLILLTVWGLGKLHKREPPRSETIRDGTMGDADSNAVKTVVLKTAPPPDRPPVEPSPSRASQRKS